MCRLMAITSSKVPQHIRLSLLERMLLLSMNDDNQIDGTGVSDGEMWYKIASPAWKATNGWQNRMAHDRPLMGHVRKKSHATGATTKEAHPFVFELKSGKQFHIAHNGFFSGNDAREWTSVGDLPNSDTFWAAKVLVDMLEANQAPRLDAPILNEWLGKFSILSAFSLMMFYGDRFTVVRGKDRPLVGFEFGHEGAYLINTSLEVAKLMHEYISTVYPALHIGEDITPIAEARLIQFDIEGNLIEAESGPLDYKLKPYTTYTSYGGHHGVGFGAAAGGSGSTKKENDDVKTSGVTVGGRSTASTDTQPIRLLPAGADEDDDTSSALQDIAVAGLSTADVFSYLRQAFAPMRQDLLLRWIAATIGIANTDPEELLMLLTLEDYEAFFESAVPGIKHHNDIYLARNGVLGNYARRLINLWNHRVPKNMEMQAIDDLYSGELFWLPNSGVTEDQLSAVLSLWAAN